MATRDPESEMRVRLSTGCGWCITDKHKDCINEITHSSPSKVWLCGCKTCWPVAKSKTNV